MISPEYFNPDGSLKSAADLDGGVWSRYNSQLGSYLTAYPEVAAAIKEYQETLTAIAEP